jgi:hypothetical protein
MCIIAIYLIVGVLLIWIPFLIKASFKLALFILFFPAIPFVVAYLNRHKKPTQANLIIILYGFLYLIFILAAIFT